MSSRTLHRRAFLAALGGAAAMAAGTAPTEARQQAPVSPTPTPRDWSRQDPVQYPDPDIVALDDRFNRYFVRNTVIRRHHFGTLWAEGPAWSGVGRFLVWSDIPNNVQLRWIEDDGRVTVFRNPSGYSNGNTFDFEGRQLSCEHGGRRVVRYEPNGTVTVIAEKFQGKRLNSPNDIVVHPDGRDLVYRSDLRDSRQLRRLPRQTRSCQWPCIAWTRRRSARKGHRRSSDRTERHLLFARLQEAVHRRHRRAAGISQVCRYRWQDHSEPKTIRPAGHSRQLVAPSAADGIRCDVDGNIWAGARPRCAGDRARRRAHRDDPPSGNLREHLLRRRRNATASS